MVNVLIRTVLLLVLIASLLLFGASCGAAVGVGVRSGYNWYDDDDDYYSYNYFDGYRNGNYIYYRGRWYLYGIGTPYEWSPYYNYY